MTTVDDATTIPLALWGVFGRPAEVYDLPPPLLGVDQARRAEIAARRRASNDKRTAERDRRRALGLCTACGEKPARAKFRWCDECRRISLENERRKRGILPEAFRVDNAAAPMPEMWGWWKDLGPGPATAKSKETRRCLCTVCNKTERVITLSELRSQGTRKCNRCNVTRGRFRLGVLPQGAP